MVYYILYTQLVDRYLITCKFLIALAMGKTRDSGFKSQSEDEQSRAIFHLDRKKQGRAYTEQ